MLGQEGQQVIRRFRRGAGGADDGAIVLAQHFLQPGDDIIGMAHGLRDGERSADDGARLFRDLS